MTLIELIGILAIISMFALFLFRALIRETDADVARKERARRCADTLRRLRCDPQELDDPGRQPDQLGNHGGSQVGLDMMNVWLNSRTAAGIVIDTNVNGTGGSAPRMSRFHMQDIRSSCPSA
jgi:hypothetical protein